jgi:hypothetical protein
MARSSFGLAERTEASNEASKKRGCYRARANSPDRQCTEKPLFINENFGVERASAASAEQGRTTNWLPGLDSNQRPFD